MKKLSAILISLCAISFLNGCDDYLTFVIEPQGDCDSEGATRYYPSEEGYCIHQICTNHRWKEIDKEKDDDNCGDVSCKKDNSGVYACGDCLNNTPEYKSENEQCMKRTCEVGEWSEYQESLGSVFCGICKDGEITYAPAPNGFCEKQVCENKKWVSMRSCGEVSCTEESMNIEGLDIETYQCGECII